MELIGPRSAELNTDHRELIHRVEHASTKKPRERGRLTHLPCLVQEPFQEPHNAKSVPTAVRHFTLLSRCLPPRGAVVAKLS